MEATWIISHTQVPSSIGLVFHEVVPLSSFPSLSLKQLLLNREKADVPPHDSLNLGCIPTLTRRAWAFSRHSKCLTALLILSLTQNCSRSSTGARCTIWAKATYPIVSYCSGQNHFPPALKQSWYLQPRTVGDSTLQTSCASTGCNSAEPLGRIQLFRVRVSRICVREAASGKSLSEDVG